MNFRVTFSHLPAFNIYGLTDLGACQWADVNCPNSPGLQFWIAGIDTADPIDGKPRSFTYAYADGETVTIEAES